MDQEQQKPAVLFVHGSWHQPSHFTRVRKVLEDADFPTLFVAHPYGGLITMQAVDKAFGKNLADTFDGNLPPWIVMQDDGMCEPQNPGDVFYHDLQGGQ
ncbi:putative AB hydrolase-1 domain-containing protein [Seiridium unicorne]|uniref:AB hydrolase-1 domain-containing protein n=1 Tax=Seiridium unicorne TaxID=138068 RepID=A0ABR2VEY4_9PEZI